MEEWIYLIFIVILVFLLAILTTKVLSLKERQYRRRRIGCADSRFGCCADQLTTCSNITCSNCDESKPIVKQLTCQESRFGCCPDGITVRNSTGSNCSYM